MTPHQLAQELRDLLAIGCERVEIAGSIRRGKPDPHDIEIVATAGADLDTRLLELQMSGRLLLDPAHRADGPRYKRRLFDGFPVDLFIVHPPAQWGLIYCIRTGPTAFSQSLLRRWKRLTHGGYSRDGCLYTRDGTAHPTPEEADVFTAVGLTTLHPGTREHYRL